MKRFLKGLLVAIALIVIVIVITGTVYGRRLNRAAAELVVPPLDLTDVANGTYVGTAAIMHVQPQVSVTVADGRITAITLLNPMVGDSAGLVDRIVAAQSLNVDGITSATITTKAIKAAISDALTP